MGNDAFVFEAIAIFLHSNAHLAAFDIAKTIFIFPFVHYVGSTIGLWKLYKVQKIVHFISILKI